MCRFIPPRFAQDTRHAFSPGLLPAQDSGEPRVTRLNVQAKRLVSRPYNPEPDEVISVGKRGGPLFR